MFDWLRQIFGKTDDSELTEYDLKIVEYLELWGRGEEEHERLAAERFGFDEDQIEWVNQVLCSAALGTLHNWANSQDDPWWQAAYRLAHSNRKGLLRPLRKSLME